MTLTAAVPMADDSTFTRGITPEGVIQRAREIGPTLVPLQAETEARTYYSEDTHAQFREAGFYRLLIPQRYGGLEFDVETFVRVVQEIARGCPSTGWMLCLGTSHALTVGTFFDERTQEELFGGGEFVCPTTVAPSGSARQAADGGWILDGTWSYCSGSPYGTHFMGHALVPGENGVPQPLLFIAPRSEWTRLDDWGKQLGLKGSGSHSVRFEGGYVPAHFAKENMQLMQLDVSGGTPGMALHQNPLYSGSPFSFFLLEAAAVIVGAVKGAMDEYDSMMTTKKTMLPPFAIRAEDADYQDWYGSALAKVSTAEAAMLSTAQQYMEACRSGEFTRYEDMRLVGISREVFGLCWDAMQDILFRTAGSGSVLDGSRMQRIWRDISTIHSHSGFVQFRQLASREVTRSRFGITPAI